MARRALVVACLVLVAGCAARSQLEGAYRAVVLVGEIQSLAIKMNGIQACVEEVCQPLLSDANTETVIDVATVALESLQAVPEGWRGALAVALRAWQARLDEDGQALLAGYLQVGQLLLETTR